MLALMLVWGGLVAYASEQARGRAPKAKSRTTGAPIAPIPDDTEPATHLPV
jgi:hypothetical protein